MLTKNSAGATPSTRERVQVRASEENYGPAKRDPTAGRVIDRRDSILHAIPEAKQWELMRGYKRASKKPRAGKIRIVRGIGL